MYNIPIVRQYDLLSNKWDDVDFQTDCLAYKKAIELNLCEIECQKQVSLIFYSYPEQYFSNKEYIAFVKEISKAEPNNELAIQIQNQLKI